MRIILLLIAFFFVFKNLDGQIIKKVTIPETIITSLDGKVYNVILREVNNSDENLIRSEEFRKPLTNSRVVLSFEKGTLEASWVGIVKGNKIQGVFSWIMEDGSAMKYFFGGTGREKEIENSQAATF